MAGRGIKIDCLTLHRWTLKITPTFNKIALRYKKPVQQFWPIDKPYIKIAKSKELGITYTKLSIIKAKP